MALITSQQIANYYEQYRSIDVTFNKQVIKAIGLRTENSFLRCLGSRWPCIIYSSSMEGAKIIANTKSDLLQKIRQANNLVSLRYCFNQQDKSDPMTFFVSSKVTGFNPYGESNADLSFIALRYTQQPSDDLIAILGALLEANINSQKRKEERIDINPETLRKLGFKSKDGLLFIDEEPRKCIIRDVSFSGAQLFVSGDEQSLLTKQAKLKISVDYIKAPHLLDGKIVRFDEISEQEGIGAVGMQFDEKRVGMEFKMRLNEYLISLRKTI